MSYGVEWIPGGVVLETVLLLLIVPQLAVIAVVIVALAALWALVALAAVALAIPYLLARALRRRRAERKRPTTIRIPRGDALARRQADRGQPALRPASAHHGGRGGAA
jgi:membrane protein implicated in regulation of membrane protease activity